jgi:hypothetical protein
MTKRCIFLALLALSTVTSAAYADGGSLGGSSQGGAADGRSSRSSAKSVALGQADNQVTAEAIAHFARSRSLIISALHEFDKGRKLASPNQLLDPVQWRNTLIDRAEDLDRVLDPQPRATKGGIKFEADPRLLPEANK